MTGLPLSLGSAIKSLTIVWKVPATDVTFVTLIVSTLVSPGLITRLGSDRTGETRKPFPPTVDPVVEDKEGEGDGVAALTEGVTIPISSAKAISKEHADLLVELRIMSLCFPFVIIVNSIKPHKL